MKKLISIFTSLLALVLVLTACSSKSDTKSEKKENVTVKVASHTAPMTDMLEMIKDDLQKEGYNLEIVKVSDNVQANVALNNKEVDANFFQHKPFMEQFNQKKDYNMIIEMGLFDTYEMAQKKDDGVTVYKNISGWEDSMNKKKLDYIFSNRELNVTESSVIFNNTNYPIISDHNGLEVTIAEK